MSDGSERRRHTRYEVQLPAVVRVKRQREELIMARVLNLSLSGAMLEIHEPIAGLGQEITVEIPAEQDIVFKGKVILRDQVEFFLGEDDEGAESIVRWSNGQGRIGIEFSHLSTESQHALERLIAFLEKNAVASKSGDGARRRT